MHQEELLTLQMQMELVKQNFILERELIIYILIQYKK